MYLGLNIGSLLFEGEPLNTNSGDPVNIALPKLQRETNGASTPASKSLSDYIIAEVENNSNRIDESVLKADFYNKYQDHCNRIFSFSTPSNSEGSANSHILKYGAKRICPPDQNTVNFFSECNVSQVSDQQQTDSASTPTSNLLSDYTIAQVENNSKYQDHCNRIFSSPTPSNSKGSANSQILKYGAKRICPPDQNTVNFFSECNVSQVSDQQQTDSASTPTSNLLSDYTIAQVENNSKYQDHCNRIFSSPTPSNSKGSRKKANSQILNVTAQNLVGNFTETPQQPSKINADFPENAFLSPNFEQLLLSRIDENVLKMDFYNNLNKVCQEEHHQNFEELSKQSLKKALEFQGRVYQDFIKEKAKLSEQKLVFPNEYEYSCIVTDCSFTNKYNAIIGRHLFKHIKVSPHYCEQCFPNIFFARDKTDLDKHKRAVHHLDKVISKRGIKRIHQRVQNIIVENNSNRIDESVLKEDFYNNLDKACQEEHHQNFEEFSKQSLKNALEFQGRVYQDFTKEKINLSEKQLVFPGRYKYPCIVTDCSFAYKHKIVLDKHLFKHIKVSPHYCEQCFPNIFFARDKTNLDKHKRSIHSRSKRGIKRIHQRQNTIVENNSKRIDESVLKEDFYNALDEKCQKEHHQNFEEFSKQSLKNALEFQGRVYQDFTKEKAKLSKQQLVSPDRYAYPCIVTDCSFAYKYRTAVNMHLFKHIKVSPYYCEQCLPYTFFVRDIASLNRHKRSIHLLDTAIPKRGIKRIHQPVQNTMNGSSGFIVNQVSDSCLPKVRVKHRPIER